MNQRTLLATAGALTASTLPGCISELTGGPVSESFSQNYTVSPEITVLISNRNGPISVRKSESDKLILSGEKQAGSQDGLDSITIDVVEGDRFVITVRFSAGSDFSNRQVDLTIGIPDGAAVDGAHTADGDVTITEVRGDLNASTTNGNVEVTDISGLIRGETTNGNDRIRNCTGVPGARTSNGNIEVELLAMRNDVTCYRRMGTSRWALAPPYRRRFASARIPETRKYGSFQIRLKSIAGDTSGGVCGVETHRFCSSDRTTAT